MSAMMQALKKKRMGGHDGDKKEPATDHGATHSGQHVDEGKTDLHSLVASLSESEKHNLKSLLHADGAGSEKIAQGAPSSEEQGHIQNAIAKEDGMNALEDEGSDDIAKSMLDSRDTAMPTHKPKNLGERMRMSLATNLKGKGKI